MNNKSIKNFVMWLLIFLAVASLTLMLNASDLGDNMWIMIPVCLITTLLGYNLPSGFVIMANEPPHFGVVTRWKKRLWKKDPNAGKMIRGRGRVPKNSRVVVIIKEGWNWIPFRGIMSGVISINMSKRSVDLPAQTLITPDLVTTEVPISIAYTPCEFHIVNLLNLGTGDPFSVLESMVADIAADKLRVWARDPNQGPTDYEKLLSASGEAEKLLIESICNATISSDTIKDIQSGHGKWEIEHFGVYLNRINLKEMKPFGEEYDKALKIKSEEKERVAETYEVETDIKKAEKLKTELRRLGVTVTIEQALEKIMAWKITREANTSMSISAIAKQIFQSMNKKATS